jgi:hypothetical protein
MISGRSCGLGNGWLPHDAQNKNCNDRKRSAHVAGSVENFGGIWTCGIEGAMPHLTQ